MKWGAPRMGENHMETKNHKPVVMAVIPVRPPSRIPVADSMNTVTGDVPINDPATIATPSEQYAIVLRGNNFLSFTNPAQA